MYMIGQFDLLLTILQVNYTQRMLNSIQHSVEPTKRSKLKIMQWSNKKWKDHPVSTKAAELKNRKREPLLTLLSAAYHAIMRNCIMKRRSEKSTFHVCHPVLVMLARDTKLRRISSFHWFICVFFILIGQVSSSICICTGALSLVLISW